MKEEKVFKGLKYKKNSKTFTDEFRKYIYSLSDNKCYYCNCKLCEITKATIDHKIPRLIGGNNDETNLVLACGSCNSKKGSMTPEGYKEWQRIKTSKEYLDALNIVNYYKARMKELRNK
jgi:5-methylcytosine-specific restriction endonuclease McrA